MGYPKEKMLKVDSGVINMNYESSLELNNSTIRGQRAAWSSVITA